MTTSLSTAGSGIPVRARARSGLRRAALLLALVLVGDALLLSVAGWSLLQSRRQFHARAAATTRNLALALERDLEGNIKQIDTTLLWMKEELERRHPDRAGEAEELNRYIDRQFARAPFLDGIQVVNRDGVFTLGIGVTRGRRVSIGDRDYFHELREPGPGRLVISKPLLGRLAHAWTVVTARRLEGPEGAFQGAVLANVDLTRFTRTLAAVNVEAHGIVVLRGEGLKSIARFPSPGGEAFNTVGLPASPELQAQVEAGAAEGTYFSTRNNQHIPRMTSFRKVPGYPFYVVVGLAAQDYLIPWRRNALQTGLLATAFLVLTLLGAWVLLASWERDRAAEARIITERERQRSAQALLEMEAQFQQAQKMESLGILAGGVAHDMNNVLGAILAVASSQLGTQPEGSPLHLALDTITRAAVRGGTMVKGLLSFARRTPGEVRELDLNAVIRDAVELLARTTLAQVRLDLRLAYGLRPVTGDASALSHALINLCVNAVDAMGGAGTLTLTTRNDGEAWVLVQVEDTGSGMAPEVLAKALDPFFTTKAHGKGTGLGLSLVYSSVKAHQGDMEIRSEPGRGTQISLRFPAAEPQAFAPAGPGPDRTAPPARRLQVLLVDDDELIQISTHMLLDMLGHATTVASSGEEALRLLGEGLQPDAVVLDMNMPGLGGAGTLGPLRGLCPEVPVILATGRADQDAMALVASGTRITLLAKPYSLGELQEQLTVLCDRTVGS